MNRNIYSPFVALLASIALVGTYLAFGGSTYHPMTVADPCVQRDPALLAERGTFEGIALSALDGAACELQVTREELTLALADEDATQEFAEAHQIDSARIEEAVRAGLVRGVDDAEAAGKVSGLEAQVLHQVAERAPVGALISALQALPGDDSIQSLLEQLGSVSDLDLPGLDEIPGVDELGDLLG